MAVAGNVKTFKAWFTKNSWTLAKEMKKMGATKVEW